MRGKLRDREYSFLDRGAGSCDARPVGQANWSSAAVQVVEQALNNLPGIAILQ